MPYLSEDEFARYLSASVIAILLLCTIAAICSGLIARRRLARQRYEESEQTFFDELNGRPMFDPQTARTRHILNRIAELRAYEDRVMSARQGYGDASTVHWRFGENRRVLNTIRKGIEYRGGKFKFTKPEKEREFNDPRRTPESPLWTIDSPMTR